MNNAPAPASTGFSYSRPEFEELVDFALAHARKLGATTQSLVMRSKSGTVRVVEAHHAPDKFI